MKKFSALLAIGLFAAAGYAAQQTINVGSSANDGAGDTLRGAFIKVNDNFTELYNEHTGVLDGNSTGSITGMVGIASSGYWIGSSNLVNVIADASAGGGGSGDFMADGSVPMTGNLDMGGNTLTDVGNFNVSLLTATNIALATPASGSILVDNGTTLEPLSAGSEGQVLKISSGVPAWGTDSSGSFSYDIDQTGIDTTDATATPLWTNAITSDSTFYADSVRIIGAGPTNSLAFTLSVAGRDTGGTPTLITDTLALQQVRTNYTDADLSTNAWAELTADGLVWMAQGLANESMHWIARGVFNETTNGPALDGGGASYLWSADMDDNTGWGTESGTVTFGSTAVDLGDGDVLAIDGTASDSYAYTGSWSPVAGTGTTYGYVVFQTTETTPTTSARVIRLFDDVTLIGRIEVFGSGSIATYHGSVNGNLSSVLSDNTTVHMWFEFTPGTGSDGSFKIGVSSDGTKPTLTETVTAGTATVSPTRLQLYGDYTTAEGRVSYFDHLRVDDEAIGSNPE
jgi:hypothetical protein